MSKTGSVWIRKNLNDAQITPLKTIILYFEKIRNGILSDMYITRYLLFFIVEKECFPKKITLMTPGTESWDFRYWRKKNTFQAFDLQ